jgi:transposase
MVYRKISPDMKQRALQLIDEGWEIDVVADVLGVASKSIGRWTNNYDIHGRVDPPSVLRGRRRILNAEAISGLLQLIRESPILFLAEIREWLALYHDQPISTTALHDNLREVGITQKILRKAATERDDFARAEWITHMTANYTARQMVILDESSKDGRTIIRKYGRAPRGEDPVLAVSLDRGIRYSILPALTLDGYTAVRVVEDPLMGQSSMTLLSMMWLVPSRLIIALLLLLRSLR